MAYTIPSQLLTNYSTSYTGGNKDQFKINALSRSPIPSTAFDNLTLFFIDIANNIDAKISSMNDQKFPVSGDKLLGNVVSIDATGNLTSLLIQDVVDQYLTSLNGLKIASNSIKTDSIGDLAVTTDKINDQNVTTPKIKDLAITNAKIAPLTIDGETKIKGASITPNKIRAIAPNSYGFLSIENGIAASQQGPTSAGYFLRTEGISGLTRYGRIKSEHLDAGIVGTFQVAEGAITTEKLAGGVVTSDKISGVIPAKIKDPNFTNQYGVMLFNAGVGQFLAGPTTEGSFLRTKGNTSGLPSFGRIDNNDLPQIGVQPIYMARWHDGVKQNEYNPFGYVTSFVKELGYGMLLNFASNVSVNSFIITANSLEYDGGAAASPMIIRRKTDGTTYLKSDHGYVVVYKIA